MIITICKDCINILKPAGVLYEPHRDSICAKAPFVNFVTGETCFHRCDWINSGGDCELFEEKQKVVL